MKTSEQIDKIAEALAKARGVIKNPEKNRTAKIPTKSGREYSYNYADLPACFDAAAAALAENGICYPSSVEYRNNTPFLLLRFIHISGQWLESEFRLSSGTEKEFAASMTYGIRYLFCGLLGISGDEDTDSEPEENAEYKDREKKVIPPQNEKPVPPTQFMGPGEWKVLESLCEAAKITSTDMGKYIVTTFNKNPKEMTKVEFDKLCTYLNQNRKA
jgi:hypothetical protein